MSEFYDISSDKSQNKDSLALKNLGEKRSTITYGFTSKASGRRNSHSFYRDITDNDYDQEFVDEMFRVKRPYEVDKLLDHHYAFYRKKEPQNKDTFLKHIKYVILPLVENKNPASPLIELTKDWLQEQKSTSIQVEKPIKSNYSQAEITASGVKATTVPVNNANGEVFMSYSWDTPEHQSKVLSFTDHLRKQGYNARLDIMLTQRESAPNFIKMMHKAMLQHKKVIVVLSEGYKKKAENFSGGVGEEYELLLNDIKQSPNKYILVSFSGRSDAITPFGLKGREIIDLSQPGGEEKLFRKLSDEKEYEFAPVGPEKPSLPPIPIPAYQSSVQAIPIAILPPNVKLGDTSSGGSLYKYIEYEVTFNFQNISSNVVDGLAYDITVKQELAPEYYGQSAKDGYFNFKHDLVKKIYPNQVVSSEVIKLKAANYSKHQFVDTKITLNVYTESGTVTEAYNVNELLAVPPPNEHYKEPMPLTKEIFI